MVVKKRAFAILFWLFLAGSSTVVMGLTAMHLYLGPTLPSIESLRDVRLQTPLRIYSSDGKLLAQYGEKRRTPVEFQEIPQAYIDAVLAAEDAEFFSHSGVSITGLMRAASQLILSGDIQSGGSTITMQVARNYFLSFKQEFRRKFREILLALRIERELTKEEILELYVNVIFLGNRAYGIQAASQVYYGKPLDELSVAQLAMIAGLPKAPSTMNPLVNPERALIRRNWILGRMYELGWLDEFDYKQASAEPVTASYHGSRTAEGVDAAYVAEIARQKAIELFGPSAYTDGYRMYTTVDSELQAAAERAVVEGLLAYDQRHGYRGPEQQLSTTGLVVPPAGSNRQDELTARATEVASTDEVDTRARKVDLELAGPKWQDVLQDIPVYAGLQPAAIVEVGEQYAKAMMANGNIVALGWEQGLSNARPYINENHVGPAPTRASDVVSLGDVIRLRERSPGKWHLEQIPAVQSALVSLDPNDGAILALVGGFDFRHNNFNRAVQAERQPGSNFKPFIYTAALEHGFTPATVINDAPIVFSDNLLETSWRPENSSGRFYGPTRLRKALYLSRNLVSIRVLRSVGVANAIEGMDRFGFDPSELPRDLSLALGSANLTPLEVATGYSVFANGGYRVEPYLIERILDFDGESVYEALPLTVCKTCEDETPQSAAAEQQHQAEVAAAYENEGELFEFSFSIKSQLGILEPQDYPKAPRVLEPEVAYIIDSMLQDVIQYGTGRRAKSLGRHDLAGKTGTTNGPTDAWFSGYNGDIVTTTWVGFDHMANLGNNEYGGSAALPIWIDYMRVALRGKPETPRLQPPGIVSVKIDPATGERARAGDPDAIFEIFRAENVPPPPREDDAPSSPYNDEVFPEELF